MAQYAKKMIDELKSKGYKYADVDQIYKKQSLQPVEVEIILKWLPSLYTEHYGTADVAVRSLKFAKEPFDPSVLIDLFENSDLNFSLKSGIAFTLVEARTLPISKWMKDQLLNKEFSLERSALVAGLYAKGDFKSIPELMNFSKKIFDKYHNDIALKLFKKYGNQDDLAFLEIQAKKADKKLAKDLGKAIEALKKRLVDN